ncbi:single-stranded-DNA-specific exonuclease RecJ [Altibacter sp. HG106]|uniref:single-stranded-DNA-specific exonuclease RecJ n=1 Tax=Altibacter sp. HG106 TaxID=3023937 RepID=UPI00234FFAD1|nr:single-stranded-DNA-specific exonuclease RecJ [Altibacter sp. HG106]MDC7994925.1 single-stranded-DNA-specific exonuclease RecJ [Altibacter sp. HG106]
MRWTLKPKPNPEVVQHLAEALGVNTTIASLLVHRGIETFEDAKKFFRPSLEDLHDPFLMKDMMAAVQRVEKAIEKEEHILIYGDYDVDGTTSVALVTSYLRSLYPKVSNYIPDRYAEGYGVSFQGIDYADDNDISLIIALDCGVKAIDKVAYAAEKGIDFIICDHHRPGDQLPRAVAVLDPKREDCDYPYKELCGCGVGFKLIQALGRRRDQPMEALIPYLDLVATAIAADIVPITGENRVLAYHGLQVMNTQPRTGIKALLQQVKKTTLTISDVVFIIAPRINAAGRMEHGNRAVALLTEEDAEQAEIIASEVEAYNASRKDTDRTMTEEALEQILQNQESDKHATVVFDPSWHKGVIGIVASRLIETYYRPTLVFTQSGDKLAASARSVRGFDVYEALTQCEAHIEQFGGHTYAAGLTLDPANYEEFKNAFEAVVADTMDPKYRTPELSIDAEIALSEITPKFYRILKQFAPFGPGNRTPVFMSSEVRDTGSGRCVGEDKSHLRLVLQQDGSPTFVGIGFGMAEKEPIACAGTLFQAAYVIDENHWQGTTQLQLRLKDIKA